MSNTHLILDDWTEGKIRIRYHFPDDEIDLDTGAALGEGGEVSVEEPQVIPNDESLEDWEAWVAEKLAAESGAERDSYGWFWETPGAAKKVLASIRKKIKAGPGVLPDVTISHKAASAALCVINGALNAAQENDDTDALKIAQKELKKVLKIK